MRLPKCRPDSHGLHGYIRETRSTGMAFAFCGRVAVAAPPRSDSTYMRRPQDSQPSRQEFHRAHAPQWLSAAGRPIHCQSPSRRQEMSAAVSLWCRSSQGDVRSCRSSTRQRTGPFREHLPLMRSPVLWVPLLCGRAEAITAVWTCTRHDGSAFAFAVDHNASNSHRGRARPVGWIYWGKSGQPRPDTARS